MRTQGGLQVRKYYTPKKRCARNFFRTTWKMPWLCAGTALAQQRSGAMTRGRGMPRVRTKGTLLPKAHPARWRGGCLNQPDEVWAPPQQKSAAGSGSRPLFLWGGFFFDRRRLGGRHCKTSFAWSGRHYAQERTHRAHRHGGQSGALGLVQPPGRSIAYVASGFTLSTTNCQPSTRLAAVPIGVGSSRVPEAEEAGSARATVIKMREMRYINLQDMIIHPFVLTYQGSIAVNVLPSFRLQNCSG